MVRCLNCKGNIGMYRYLFERDKTYMCQHALVHEDSICAICIINNHRFMNGLSFITKIQLKSKSCVNWLIGDSKYRQCWDTDVLNIKKCDAPNCKHPANKLDNYLSIHKIIDEVKKTINLPKVIFDIIFSQLFQEICAGGNGLCVVHDKVYKGTRLYKGCVECVFSVIPQCIPCHRWIHTVHNSGLDTLKCINHNINLHHETHNKCYKYLISPHCIDIDLNCYSAGWCLDICRKLKTWCDICEKCIGHPKSYQYFDSHNIINYPHCLTCGTHSCYPHCSKCNKHSKCVCNVKIFTSVIK